MMYLMLSKGREHSHAFYSVPSLTRVAEVVFARGHLPEVTSGLRNHRVLKTTQSAFVDFVDDEFRTLPDAKDRLFSTIVTADWKYNSVRQGAIFSKNNYMTWVFTRRLFSH